MYRVGKNELIITKQLRLIEAIYVSTHVRNENKNRNIHRNMRQTIDEFTPNVRLFWFDFIPMVVSLYKFTILHNIKLR